MEQRPLRLGDILDDYCPRERRVTNHAIVAMIEENVRQTRCMTCDSEHVYKGGKAPRRRVKKESPAALYKEVLAGISDPEGSPTRAAPVRAQPAPRDEPAAPVAMADEAREELPGTVEDAAERPFALSVQAVIAERAERAVPEIAATASAEDAVPPAVEEGPVHRPLIRATLPRPEGHKEARPIPDFTMRQPPGRGRFRGDGRMRTRGGPGPAGHGPNGNRPNGGARFGGPRPAGRRKRSR